MPIKITGKDGKELERFLLFNDKTKRPWLSPKMLEGYREINLKELDKLLPRNGHSWRITPRGGLTFRTDAELEELKKVQETEAKARATRTKNREKNKYAKEFVAKANERALKNAQIALEAAKSMFKNARSKDSKLKVEDVI